jgi:hypothetical protein
MDQGTRTRLESAREEIESTLRAYFADWEHGPVVSGIDLVENPAFGLVLQIRQWIVPHGRVLDIFIGAHASGKSDDETGILEGEASGDGRHASAGELILFHFLERLATGDFQARWSEGSNGHLSVNLYG